MSKLIQHLEQCNLTSNDGWGTKDLEQLQKLFRDLFDEIEKESYATGGLVEFGETVRAVDLDRLRTVFQRFTGRQL